MKKSGKALRREIRVFISSTFSDMQSERNYLVKHVFPDIERRCRERNVEFTALDLRWGITEEESQSGRVVEICLDEIERTRPFFIGLVGGRYGWIPPKDASNIDVERLCERFPWIGDCFEHGLSITEMEMRYGVLDSPEDVEAHFFVRTDRSIPQRYRESNAGAEAKRRHLIEDIRKAAAEDRCTVADYRSLSQLGREVHRRLMDTLDRLFPADAAGNIYREALNATERQCEQLRRVYVPRNETHNSYLLNKGYFEHVLVYGSAGDGVSAFVANELSDMAIAGAGENATFPLRIVRTIVGDDISSLEMLRRVFVQRLMLFNPEVEVPEMSGQLSDEIPFADILTRFPMAEYVWVIDGPEKLSNEAERGLGALLSLAGTIDHFIIATSDKDVADAVGNVLGKNKVMVMLTSLGVPVRRRIVDQYLARAGKRLNERQVSAIAGADVLSNVGVLRTFVDILTGFGVYEDVDEFIHSFVTVDRIEQFYERVLTYLEDEYGRETVAEVMRRLLHSGVGLTEEALFDGVVRLPLERAALLGGLGRFAVRRNGRLRLTDKMLRAAAAERYPIEEKDSKRLSRLVIADCKRGRDQLRRLMRREPWYVQLIWKYLMRGMQVTTSEADGAKWSELTTELCRQYAGLEKYNEIYKLMCHFGSFGDGTEGPEKKFTIMRLLKDHGYKAWQMFDNRDILVAHLMLESTSILPVAIKMSMGLEADEEKEFYDRLGRKWLPKKVKSALLKQISIDVDDISRRLDAKDLEDIDTKLAVEMLLAAMNTLTEFEAVNADKLYRKVKDVVESPHDAMAHSALLLIMVILALRLNLRDEYNKYIELLKREPLNTLTRAEMFYLEALYGLRYGEKPESVRDYARSFLAEQDKYKGMNPNQLMIEVAHIVEALTKGRLDAGVVELLKRYPQGNADSVTCNVAIVMHNMQQYEAAHAIVCAMLRLELTNHDRYVLLYWKADLCRRLARYNEADAAMNDLEALKPDDNGYPRWRILIQRADIARFRDDYTSFEKYCRELLEYADTKKPDNAAYLRYLAHTRLAALAEEMRDNVRIADEGRPRYARECVAELQKALEYKQMNEDTYAHNWGRYVKAVLALDQYEKVAEDDLKKLLESTEATARVNNLSYATDLRTGLGCLYLRLGMQDRFDALVKDHYTLVCASRMTQTLAAYYRLDPKGNGLNVMSWAQDVLVAWLDGKTYEGERRTSLITHLEDVMEVLTPENIKVMYEVDVEEYPSERNICRALIWQMVQIMTENYEEVRRLDAALARVLASRRWDDGVYLRYLRVRCDISGDPTRRFDAPEAAAQECYMHLLERINAGTGVSAEMAALRNAAMRDINAASDIVRRALDAEGPESPTICQLMARYRDIVKNGNIEDWSPMVVFLQTLLENEPAGAPIYGLIADEAAEITELMGDYLVWTWRWLNLEAWQLLSALLERCGRGHGPYMAWMGIHAMGPGDESKAYHRAWTEANGGSVTVEMAMLQNLEYADDMPVIRHRLGVMAKVLTPENAPDNTYQRMLLEQAYLRGYDGDYAGALESFGRLCEAEGRPNDCYNTHISTEFPLCMAVMARDNDRFLALIDNIAPARMRDMMLCAYYLANDNEASARRQYDNPSQNEPPADAAEEWRELHAATAMRHIEMARYARRHGTGEQRRWLDEADKILDLYPGRLLYLRNYLQKVKNEL